MKKFARKYKQRLLKLAEHLETGKLFHDRFDFSVFHEKYPCGSVGCALGECPGLWPRSWEFDSNDEPNLKISRDARGWTLDSAREFFGLGFADPHNLFCPGVERPWMRDTVLSEKATRKQVAKSIRKFVEWKEAQV